MKRKHKSRLKRKTKLKSVMWLKKRADKLYSMYIRISNSKNGLVKCFTCHSWKTIDEMSINYKGIKSHCEYCLSNSYDDERGNCICCGAPRQKGIQFEYRLTPDVWCSTAYDDDLLASS